MYLTLDIRIQGDRLLWRLNSIRAYGSPRDGWLNWSRKGWAPLEQGGVVSSKDGLRLVLEQLQALLGEGEDLGTGRQ